jgi:uncharacterized protein (DUF2267 family)
MQHEDLRLALSSTGSFLSDEDAQRALLATLEILGYALPGTLLRELSALLPRSYASVLWLGQSASEAARRLAHAPPCWDPRDLERPAIGEMRVVCSALRGLMPSELVHKIEARLPAQLACLFTRADPPAQSRANGTMSVEHTASHGDRASE